MNTGYRNSHLAEGYGRSYSRCFEDNPYRSLLWDAEKGFLDDLLGRFFPAAAPRHLDFACGTGRILAYLEGRTARSVGVDLSPTMIEVAREAAVKAEIIQADITVDDVLADSEFDLVTAFRFFPNAEEALRDQAMEAILKHLAPGGLLVFNNHKNLRSTRNRLARLVGRGRTVDPTLGSISEFVGRHGLTIRRIYHVGVLPSSERGLVLPRAILASVEGILSRIPSLRGCAENQVFVCSR